MINRPQGQKLGAPLLLVTKVFRYISSSTYGAVATKNQYKLFIGIEREDSSWIEHFYLVGSDVFKRCVNC